MLRSRCARPQRVFSCPTRKVLPRLAPITSWVCRVAAGVLVAAGPDAHLGLLATIVTCTRLLTPVDPSIRPTADAVSPRLRRRRTATSSLRPTIVLVRRPTKRPGLPITAASLADGVVALPCGGVIEPGLRPKDRARWLRRDARPDRGPHSVFRITTASTPDKP